MNIMMQKALIYKAKNIFLHNVYIHISFKWWNFKDGMAYACTYMFGSARKLWITLDVVKEYVRICQKPRKFKISIAVLISVHFSVLIYVHFSVLISVHFSAGSESEMLFEALCHFEIDLELDCATVVIRTNTNT